MTPVRCPKCNRLLGYFDGKGVTQCPRCRKEAKVFFDTKQNITEIRASQNAIYPFKGQMAFFFIYLESAEMHYKSAKMVERTTEKTQEGYALWQKQISAVLKAMKL